MFHGSMVGQRILQCGFEIGINVASQAVTVGRCQEVIGNIAQVVVSIRIRFTPNPVGPARFITRSVYQLRAVPELLSRF